MIFKFIRHKIYLSCMHNFEMSASHYNQHRMSPILRPRKEKSALYAQVCLESQWILSMIITLIATLSRVV